MLAAIFTMGFNINAQNSSVVLCKLLYYVSYIFTRLPSTVLILASIDRLLLSSQNVDTRLYSSKRLAYFSISISTFFWVIFYIHALIKIDIYQIYPSIFICYYDTSGFYFEFITFSSLLINVISSVIVIILSILAFKNVRQLRAVPHQRRNRIRSMNKKDFQLLRCLYVHDIVHIIFSIFPSMFSVYLAATKHQTYAPLRVATENFLNGFAIFIHQIPYCASFFIFISLSKAFRLEIKRLIGKLFGKDLMAIQEEENRQQNVGRDNLELNVVVSTIELPA